MGTSSSSMVEGKAVFKTSSMSDEFVKYLDSTTQSGQVEEMSIVDYAGA